MLRRPPGARSRGPRGPVQLRPSPITPQGPLFHTHPWGPLYRHEGEPLWGPRVPSHAGPIYEEAPPMPRPRTEATESVEAPGAAEAQSPPMSVSPVSLSGSRHTQTLPVASPAVSYDHISKTGPFRFWCTLPFRFTSRWFHSSRFHRFPGAIAQNSLHALLHRGVPAPIG